MHNAPQAPRSIEDTGLNPLFLEQLIVKGMFMENLDRASQMSDQMKLPPKIIDEVLESLKARKLLETLGLAGGNALGGMRYGLTQAGKAMAGEALEQSQYFGPAPVPLDAFRERVLSQQIGSEHISRADIETSFADIVVPEDFVKRLGPAVNSGRSILIYGPAGNGKTTVAEKVANIFEATIDIPYCIEVDGAVIKLFDPSVHRPVRTVQDQAEPERKSALLRNAVDQRWVACQRPVVVTGGELNLEMLDLKFNELAKFYEAPLHVKALNGTFIIDDFGRQLVSPEDLLNRWIVPLQSRVDYLTLHSGKSFSIPFDELVIFSTNMAPDDLMDPAFLRRIPYKLETKEPSVDAFREIFVAVAGKAGLQLTDDIFDFTLHELRETAGKPLACYQPKFIVDQVVNACKYHGQPAQFTKEFVVDALDNLYVRDSSYVGQVGMSQPEDVASAA